MFLEHKAPVEYFKSFTSVIFLICILGCGFQIYARHWDIITALEFVF